MKHKTNYKITPEEFICAWETSDTVDEAVTKIREICLQKKTPPMEKDIVLSRASAYRTSGVRLKKMRRKHGRPIDVESLNRLITSIKRGSAHTG